MKFAGKRFYFPENLESKSSDTDNMVDVVHKFQIGCIKTLDDAILDAIVRTAREEGITDLIVFDKDFVISALREKMERECET